MLIQDIFPKDGPDEFYHACQHLTTVTDVIYEDAKLVDATLY